MYGLAPSWGQATAETIVLTPDWTQANLSHAMEFLEDPQSGYTIEDLTDPAGGLGRQWLITQRHLIRLENVDSTYWGRFTVKNDLPRARELLLQVGNPHVDSIQFFAPGPDPGYLRIATGDRLPFAQRPFRHRHFLFPVEVPAHTVRTFYLRLQSATPITMSPRLWDQRALVETLAARDHQAGFFYGLVLMMILFNLFMFISLRLRAHLYLVLYALGLGGWYMSITGFGFQFLWPDNPWWQNRSIPFFLAFMVFFSVLFHRSLLDTKRQTPRLDWILKSLYLLGILAMALPLATGELLSLGINTQWTWFNQLLLIGLSFYFFLFRRYTPARFLVLGAVSYLLAYLMRMLVGTGVIPPGGVNAWAGKLGPWLHAVFLSLALADKVNLLKRDMLRAKDAALEHLRAADKLKDDILANTSHELLTPLNGIVGLSEGMIASPDDPPSSRQNKALTMIQQSARRLSHLIGDILDFSRLRERGLELYLAPVDLRLVIDDVLEVCQPLVGQKSLILRYDLPRETLCVVADEARLKQILFNLVGNAIKFTNSGEVKVHAVAADDRVKIGVSDTGIGIPEDKQETIFASFQQVDPSINRAFGGAGLGLSITRQLVELHGGEISLVSEPGQGTTFWFELAQARTADPVPGEPDLPTPLTRNEVVPKTIVTGQPGFIPKAGSTAKEGRTILVVDDEPINLQVLEDFLTAEGYHVLTALDGPRALQLFQEIQPDLVVLDLMMPGMSGHEVCRKMRETEDATTLPILILTARPAADNLAPAFSCGANDFLSKPFHRPELIIRVNNLIKIRELGETRQAKTFLEHEMHAGGQMAGQPLSGLGGQEPGLVAVDKHLKVIYVNPRARDLLQLEEIDPAGLKVADLFEPRSFHDLGLKQGDFFARDTIGEKVQHGLVRFRRRSGEVFAVSMITSVVQHEQGATLVMILQPVTAESQIITPGLSPRRVVVLAMCAALKLWESAGLGDKIDLAEKTGLWTVYTNVSTPVTRTLDKYLQAKTLPKRPRYVQVLKTLDFVLIRCPEPSPARDKLAEYRNLLGIWLGIEVDARISS